MAGKSLKEIDAYSVVGQRAPPLAAGPKEMSRITTNHGPSWALVGQQPPEKGARAALEHIMTYFDFFEHLSSSSVVRWKKVREEKKG